MFNLIRENLKLEVEVFYNDGSSEYIGYNYENLWFASDVLELKEEGTYFVRLDRRRSAYLPLKRT